MSGVDSKKELIRKTAESDLEYFINLVHPLSVLGSVHRELIKWWNRGDAKSHQLVLLPRDHQKSRLLAYRVAWEITRNPAIRVIYVSSTSTLAKKQAKFIKDILTHENYRRFWPEMVNENESDREKWTETEFSVDHPIRKQEAIRDATVFTAGMDTSITGLHCDIAALDDVVVWENSQTEDGREKVKTQYSLLASIEGAEAKEWVVGTRYDSVDLYYDLISKTVDIYDEDGELIESEPLFEIFERQVESVGDGTGEFIWPRQQRADGKWFGFDTKILAQKKAKYLDQAQFRAQYYNDPHNYADAPIKPEYFQYYDPVHLSRRSGRWYFKNSRLNVFAAIDFAYSLQRRADYTSIVVVGVDGNYNYYVLDVDRFKTDKIGDYFTRILRLHQKWDFRKIRAETTSAQKVIVEDLKENYVRRHGLSLVVEGVPTTGKQGTKDERIEAALQPRYQNLQMWHYRGGHCQVLEEELISRKPPHDDVKDALAACIETCVAPSAAMSGFRIGRVNEIFNSRFGGIG